MKTTHNARVAILGTRARGGIRAVIENHIESGVYDGATYYELYTHEEGSVIQRVSLAARTLLRFLSLLLRRQLDICHIHGSMKGSIYRKSVFVFLCRLFRVQVIFHLHGSEFEDYYNRAGTVYRAVVRYVLDSSDYIFVLSRYWQDFLRTICTNHNILIVNNFPSTRFECLLSGRSYEGQQNLNFLFLGYLGQRKGIYDLVDAVASVRDQLPAGFCIHVGGNGEQEKVERYIAERGVGQHFDIHGWVSGEQKDHLLRQCNVLLLPSHNEGMPIAILEAFAAGLTVVSTRVGGIPDLITDDSVGLLIDAGDVDGLAKRIRQLLSAQDLIESTAANANRVYSEHFSATANVARIRTIYSELLAIA
ncbi:MAG: glycosyltransferase family 4 protein [Oceanospirillaceae bacterium]|nr:glycosyltransferase family 4 protein [Oceanospirillaceae bacterium]